jgi:transposase
MKKHAEEFKRETVGIALTSSLTPERLPADMGVGKSTLHKWIADYQPTDLTIDPQADPAHENQRFRKENCSDPCAVF